MAPTKSEQMTYFYLKKKSRKRRERFPEGFTMVERREEGIESEQINVREKEVSANVEKLGIKEKKLGT